MNFQVLPRSNTGRRPITPPDRARPTTPDHAGSHSTQSYRFYAKMVPVRHHGDLPRDRGRAPTASPRGCSDSSMTSITSARHCSADSNQQRQVGARGPVANRNPTRPSDWRVGPLQVRRDENRGRQTRTIAYRDPNTCPATEPNRAWNPRCSLFLSASGIPGCFTGPSMSAIVPVRTRRGGSSPASSRRGRLLGAW